MQWWCVLWLQASRDAGMWNAGWNEVIWPNACFHLRPEETVSPALPFPTPSYLSLSFPLALSLSLSHKHTHTHAQTNTHPRTNTHPHTNTHTSDHPCYFTPQVKRGADIRNKFRKWQRTEETCYIYQSNPLHRFSIFLPLCSVLPLNVTTSMTVIIMYSSSMFSLCEMTSTPITAY